jgi:hypothetical protein
MPPPNDGAGAGDQRAADGVDAAAALPPLPPSLARLFDSPFFDATMALT